MQSSERDMLTLQGVQQKATQMVTGLEHVSYKGQLRLSHLEKAHGDLYQCVQVSDEGKRLEETTALQKKSQNLFNGI